MNRKKTTVYIEENLLRSAKVAAARSGKKEYEIFEEALRTYLGFDVLDKVWEREGLPDEEEATRLAYEELHALRRAEEQETNGGSAG